MRERIKEMNNDKYERLKHKSVINKCMKFVAKKSKCCVEILRYFITIEKQN